MDEVATWRGRPGRVWTLALLCAIGSALASVGLLLAAPGRVTTIVDVALIVTGAVLATTLWCRSHRVGAAEVHLTLVVATTGTAAMVARSVTGEGAVATSMGLLWLAIYVAIFLPRRAVRLHLALQVGALAVALRISVPTSRGLLAWVLVASSSVAAASVLARLYAQLRQLTVTDPLTGALNRAGLHEVFASERDRATRASTGLVVAMIDLDGFKAVNDRLGHVAGDRLLVEVVDTWRTALRPDDRVVRLGGDEFVLFLPGLDTADAAVVLERLARASATPFTAGLAELEPDDELDRLLQRADAAMYHAKHAHRLTG